MTTTSSCMIGSNGTCPAGKSSRVWYCRLAIAVLSFSVFVGFWVMLVNIELILDWVATKFRSWMTKTSVYVVLNIVIVTIRLNSGPLTLQQEMGSFSCSSSIPVSKPYICEKPKPCCNINGEAMAEVEKNEKNNTHSKSKMMRSATNLSNLSNLCCRKTPETESAMVSPCSTYGKSGLVIFEICGIAEEEVYNYSEPKQEEEKGLVIRYREMEIGRDELYDKAESFIRNFRRQLKMQRDDSWNNLASSM